MLRVLVLLAATLVPMVVIANDVLPIAERKKIESLIAVVEKLPNAVFVRNGKNHDAKTAAKFLRGKWRHDAKSIRSAEEFIETVATRSSITGKPYLVRYQDGRQVPVAALLREELRKLR